MEENPYQSPKIPSEPGAPQVRRNYAAIGWYVLIFCILAVVAAILPSVTFYVD